MQPRVLFLTTNGAGLGHLTRSVAMARRLPSGIDAVFLTQSQALPVVVAEGFLTEYIVSMSYSGLPPATWNPVYESRVRHALDVYDPAVVVFDGVFPHRGLRTVMHEDHRRSWVWSRRAMWRETYSDAALETDASFDLVIEPGEFAADADRGATVALRDEAARVDPILLLDEDELLSREAAEAELGLSPGGTNVLLQLGAGEINDITSDTGMIVDRLRDWPDTRIVVAESPITRTSVMLPEGVVRARTYPVSRLSRAFDLTICATGYNTFHEALVFRLPALYVPNEETSADDQVARAVFAEQAGVGIAWRPRTPARLDETLRLLQDPSVRAAMADRLKALRLRNGAGDAATLIGRLVEQSLGVTR